MTSKLKYTYQLYRSFLRIKDDEALSSTLPNFKSATATLLKRSHEIVNSLKTEYTDNSKEEKKIKGKKFKKLS